MGQRGSSCLDVNPPKSIYDVMWDLYVRYEIELLQPDVVVAAGNDVARALARGLKQGDIAPFLVKVPFPGRLNLNSRWVPVGKKLAQGGHDPRHDIKNSGSCYAALAIRTSGSTGRSLPTGTTSRK